MTPLNAIVFLFALVVVLSAAQLVGTPARRVGQPPVVGEVVAGVLHGPRCSAARYRNCCSPGRPTGPDRAGERRRGGVRGVEVGKGSMSPARHHQVESISLHQER
ncbi:hypothetical protein [Saccharothrix yanglingensis]|uniref:hypothetical protein n=1 Tax=Saccharothrix yanglingensis TaxID=659496 RepID=UPI0027D21C8D|nr:hypothetical protein [Saccharothrix yanglingensis]